MIKQSAFALETFPNIPALEGIKIYTGASGERYQERDDCWIAIFDEDYQIGGVTTKSTTRAPSIDHIKTVIAQGQVRALMVNSGNANAFSGHAGSMAVVECAEYLAQKLHTKNCKIALASTGVIGDALDSKLLLDCMHHSIGLGHVANFESAAQAMMTTDTFAKGSSCTTHIADQQVQLCGIAKGSGMIAPNMATMLAFIFTDAGLSSDVLQHCLHHSVKKSFNAISVDSDTSTNDMCLLISTKKNNNQHIDKDDPTLDHFKHHLDRVCHDLAMQIIGDGEGVTKVIEVEVVGAFNDIAAQSIARSIVNSPLVKTAIAGGDANWGRVIMAVGKSGEAVERDFLSIWFGTILVASQGAKYDGYQESELNSYLKNKYIKIKIDVGIGGKGKAVFWGNDLSQGYLDINGSYRS